MPQFIDLRLPLFLSRTLRLAFSNTKRIRRMTLARLILSKIKMYLLSSNHLLNGYLSFAHFDGINGQPKMSRRKRLVIDLLIKLVVLVNAIKIAAIVLNQWMPDLKLYLVELFLFDERHQKILDNGLSIVQFGLCFCISYWNGLNRNVNVLRCFDFLFIPRNATTANDTFKIYKRRYNLDRKSTQKFLTFCRIFYALLIPTLVVYALFLIGLIIRCLYFSYQTVSLTYFFTVLPLLTALTLGTYFIADIFVITKLFTLFLSTEFMLLRIRSIDRLVFRKLVLKHKTNPPVSISDPVRLRKQESSTIKVLRALSDFSKQFADVNTVLDASLSRIILGIYLGLLGLPYFLVFVESTPLLIRLIICVIAISISLLCYTISFCNDRLRRQVNRICGGFPNRLGSNRL